MPIGSLIVSMVFAVLVSCALVITRMFGPGFLNWHRVIIVGGMWLVSAWVVLFVLRDDGTSNSSYSGYVGAGGGCSGYRARSPGGALGGAAAFGPYGSAQSYHTTKDVFGDGYTTRGSDGSLYRTRDDPFGDGKTTGRG